MDYEEKYKAALERAKQFSEKPLLEDSAGIVEYIFPELAESEDEMTRKELKHYLEAKRKQVVDNDLPDQEYRDCTRFIAWLEAISKKETMFQNKLSEDEKIRRELIEHVIWSEDNQDISTDEMERWLAWLEKQGRVKESTISQHENKTCKENDDSLTSEDEMIRKEIRDFICWSTDKGCITKEQVEKSNSWLAWLASPVLSNSSNVGKDEQKPADKVKVMNHSYITPNPKFFQWIYDRLVYIHKENPDMDYMLSLKERIEDMQNPTEWSEKDEKMLNDILMCGERHCYLDAGNIAWLKSLKDRVQPKQEWSEEDEEILKLIKFAVSNLPSQREDTRQECLAWLESLKDRVK